MATTPSREQAYYDEWDEAALRGIIQRQRKITETSKKLEMKKLYQVLIILDDYADSPQLHKPHGALDTLFIRGRHLQISTWVSSQKLRLISAAVRVNMQFLCCWRLRNQHELEAVIEELSRTSCTGSTSRRPESPTASSSSTTSSQRIKCSTCASKSVLHWKEKPMGAALSFLGQKLFASSTLINARCENISCCASVAAVQPPIVRRTGGFLKKRMTTIYVDSRKRVADSNSDFEVDLGESLHMQSDARLAVYKIRIADSFLSTDRGPLLVDAALGTLSYCYLQRDHEQPQRSLRRQPPHSERSGAQQQFPNVVDYPTSPGASPSKPFSIDHMLGPSFVSGGQQVFEFVRMMAYNEVYLRCPQLANASRVLGNLGDDILSKITLRDTCASG